MGTWVTIWLEILVILRWTSCHSRVYIWRRSSPWHHHRVTTYMHASFLIVMNLIYWLLLNMLLVASLLTPPRVALPWILHVTWSATSSSIVSSSAMLLILLLVSSTRPLRGLTLALFIIIARSCTSCISCSSWTCSSNWIQSCASCTSTNWRYKRWIRASIDHLTTINYKIEFSNNIKINLLTWINVMCRLWIRMWVSWSLHIMIMMSS